MGTVRFLGWVDLWHECARCGLRSRPAFRIMDTRYAWEERVCESCFRTLLRLQPGDQGVL